MPEPIYRIQIEMDLNDDQARQFLEDNAEDFAAFAVAFSRPAVRSYLLAREEAIINWIRDGGLAEDI